MRCEMIPPTGTMIGSAPPSVHTTPRTVPQDNQEWAGVVDELMAEAPATAVDRVPVVKLDMRIIFHGAAVACSLSLTNVNAVLAAAPGLVASSQSGYK